MHTTATATTLRYRHSDGTIKERTFASDEDRKVFEGAGTSMGAIVEILDDPPATYTQSTPWLENGQVIHLHGLRWRLSNKEEHHGPWAEDTFVTFDTTAIGVTHDGDVDPMVIASVRREGGWGVQGNMNALWTVER